MNISNQSNAEQRLAKLNETLLGFGPDPTDNIGRLVALAGEQLNASFALYSKIYNSSLHTVVQWNVPDKFDSIRKADGSMYTDGIRNGGELPLVVRDLQKSSYAALDPNITRLGLHTCVGKGVSFDGKCVGSVCMVYQSAYEPSADDLGMLSIITTAIAVEEKRKNADEELTSARREAEQALSLLNASLEATTDGILVVNQSGGIVTANRKFAELWEIPHDLLSSGDDKRLLDFVLNQLADPDAFIAKVQELYHDTEASSFDTLEFKDGRVFERVSHPQRVGGEVVGRVWCFRDVTHRTRAEQALQDREGLLKAVLHNMPQLVFWKDRNSQFLGCNRNFALATHVGVPETIIGKTDLFMGSTIEDEALFRSEDQRVMESDTPEHNIREIREKVNGAPAWIETIKVPMHAADGSVIGVLGICNDITQRRLYDEALAYRLELEQLISSVSTSFINVSLDHIDVAIHNALRAIGSFAGVDRSYVFTWQQFGISMRNAYEWCAEGIASQRQHQQDIPVNSVRWWMEQLERFDTIYIPSVAALSEEANVEKEILQAQQVLSIVAVPLIYRGELFGFWGFDSVRNMKEWATEDIALLRTAGEIIVSALNRKRAEEALRLSDSILRRVGNIVLVADQAGMITYASPSVKHVLGYEPFALLHDGWWKLTRADRHETEIEHEKIRQSALQEVPLREEPYENSIRHANGELRTILWQDAAGPAGSIIGVGIDITERKAAEEQLRKLSQAVEQSPSSIVIMNTDGEIEYANPKFTAVSGYSFDEIRGQNQRILLPDDFAEDKRNALWSTVTDGREWRGEFQNKRKDGELIWEFAAFSPIKDEGGVITHFLALIEDITEKKNLETQFLRSQRMESIGTLAGGIAHDLNNVLAPIQMSVHLLEKNVADERGQKYLQTIQSSVTRASSIVKQVLTFARGAGGERNILQIKHLIREMENIAVETFPRHIRIELSIPSDLWNVVADPTQLHQVMMNLCVNARDAMPDGGTLTISAQNIVVDEHYARMHYEAKAGQYVMMTIGDTGMGIPKAILEKIFDPFFTTKAVGKGTGLGLSTVTAIVKGHGGFINVYSEVARGTMFRVYLPATVSQEAQRAYEVQEQLARGNGELVLVVDDEPNIGNVTAEILEQYGYRTLFAHDGTEALAIYVQKKSEIQIVVTDIMMPYMDGNALIRALRKMDPSIKILATSGLAKNRSEVEHEGRPVPFLAKPYTTERLLTTLSQINAG